MNKYETSVRHRRHHHHHHQPQQQQQPESSDGDAGDEHSGRRSIVAIVHRFGRQTSMHGVPNAIRAHSMTGRIFWSLVCINAACIFGFQLTQLLMKYFSYPRKVVIEVLPLAAPFPSISLCNMRNLDTIVLNRLNLIFLQTNDIGAMLQQFAGDLPPLNVTASPASVDDARDNDTHPLFRRRRSWSNHDASAAEDATAIRNDKWIRLMKNVLWEKRRRRKAEPGFQTRRSSFASSSAGRKGSTTRQKRDGRPRRRHSRQTDAEAEDEDIVDEDYVDAEALNSPVNEFILSYMKEVSKYWPMFRAADMEMQHVFQSVLTRTTLATNLDRTTLTSAGVPFKEFVVTCRYFIALSALYTVCQKTFFIVTLANVDLL